MTQRELLYQIAKAFNLRSTIKRYLLVGLEGAGKDEQAVAAMMDLIDRGCYQQIDNIVKQFTKEGE